MKLVTRKNAFKTLKSKSIKEKLNKTIVKAFDGTLLLENFKQGVLKQFLDFGNENSFNRKFK